MSQPAALVARAEVVRFMALGGGKLKFDPVRTSCDSAVAAAAATRAGVAMFAKNSDRMPHEECQHLRQIPAADHGAGSRLRCQYVEIDQVERTHAVLLSSPYWLWGAEHGVNEYAVAIGNHTIFTKDPAASTGLVGMDLVRLGLERGRSAEEAVNVIIELIERYGQGGSGYVDTDWPYHNSFLVADAKDAFLLEASAENWALKRFGAVGSASNHTTIGTDWERLSAGCVEHATNEGWWVPAAPDQRFDFAAAFRDSSLIPPVVSSGRYRATCDALNASVGRHDLASFQRMMRDHYDDGDLFRPGLEPDDERFFSVCKHDITGATTASMIAELRDDGPIPLTCWVSFCNPCIGPYLPVFPEGRVPDEMQRGGADASAGGAWWRFRELLTLVETDYVRLGPIARDFWQPFEEETEASVAELTGRLADSHGADSRRHRGEILTGVMVDVWSEASERIDDLAARLRSEI